ncbi:SpoIIE family protein phosphatase [Streptomyces sp. MI02-2A]|uniref:SpoIIE family protein phosphatase n=1 Tax=unclassified Streptomyces TaxID=2593676 RepID=UPI000E36F857|nr:MULTISPECIES: SpoIIE family protein phosphatase [unclassified Streptomyces]MDX3262437.1 SpoIIE family protein phosphatase [Streptomyces sp. MI02-2A]REE61510.1 GAF domain-containing protein [Streptomyces sp. 3212.3]
MFGHEEGAAPRQGASVLDHEVGRLARAVDAHLVAAYLDVPEDRIIGMTVVTGMPTRIARAWSRVARAAPVPVADAVRTGRPVWVSSHQEFARRFPRVALAFPYPAAMYVAPLVDNGTCWGAVLLLWLGTRSPELSADEKRQIDDACRRMASALRRSAEADEPVRPRPDPLAMEPPSPQVDDLATQIVDRLPEGVCGLDLDGRVTFLGLRACELLGSSPGELLRQRLWETLPWLDGPAQENAYVSALFSRLPAGFSARRPDGQWLSFVLYADDRGITLRIRMIDLSDDDREIVQASHSGAPVRADTLFHLLHLASALTQAVSVKEVTDSISEQMMPVLDAQGFALLVAEGGRLHVVSSRGFPRELSEYFEGLPMATVTEGVRTIESGAASFHPDSAALLRAYPGIERYGDMAAVAYLPLTVSGRTIGCCVLGYDRRRPFAPDERAELGCLAGVIAQALERARLYDASARAARDLQAGLLPSDLPRLRGLRTEAYYQPATSILDVGGDFYDLIRLDEATAAAVIGDVQGHSSPAAALMGQLRTAVHTHAQGGASPDVILSRANCLLADLNTDLFASCLYAHIDLRRQRALLAMAGHPPPILRRPDGRTEVLDLPPGLLLGVEPDTKFHTTEIALPPGSLLTFYTDGLVERPGTDLGNAVNNLAECISQAPPGPLHALCKRLLRLSEETEAHDNRGNSDDIALLLLETDDLTIDAVP